MKTKVTQTKFKSALEVAGQLFSRIACLGAVILICNSASAQNLFVSANDNSGGMILKFTWDGVRSIFVTGLPATRGMTFDQAGNLYVAAGEGGLLGDRIYKITPGGVQSIFASGLDHPVYLAVDAAGNLFVSDDGSGSIYKYKPNGTRATFGSLSQPGGLAFNSAGNLFVACPGSGSVYEYKPNGTRSVFASGLGQPWDLAFDSTGNLYVATIGPNTLSGSIIKFALRGRTTFATGLNAPVSLVCDSAGNVFVVDSRLNEVPSEIYEFAPDGNRHTFAKGEPSSDPSLEYGYLALPAQVCCQ
jgi:DNA-binding beta-propeller fold protein YncE